MRTQLAAAAETVNSFLQGDTPRKTEKVLTFIHERFPDFAVEDLFDFKEIPDAKKFLASLLASVQSNPYQTAERVGAADTELHFETLRCTTRLYCLSLLNQAAKANRAGDIIALDEAYQAFIKAQISDPDNPPILHEDSFMQVVDVVARLDFNQRQALIINTLISSLVLTPQVKEVVRVILEKQKELKASEDETVRVKAARVVEVLENPAVLNDSIIFLKKLCGDAELIKEIYPFVTEFSEEAIALACQCFSAGHLRWYLYTEGNDSSVYDDLIQKISSGEFNERVLHSWFCYWLINIAGFRGHEGKLNLANQGWQGARYLNENTWRAILNFKIHLDNLFRNSGYPILTRWLESRARWCGFHEIADASERRFLAHLACLTRTYDRQDGELMRVAFYRLAEDLRKEITDTYHPEKTPARVAGAAAGGAGLFQAEAVVVAEAIPVATYLPQIFTNIENFALRKGLSRKNAKLVSTEIGLRLYLSAYKDYVLQRHTKTIDSRLPLSFNGLTREENLERLLTLKTKPDELLEERYFETKVAYRVLVDPGRGATSLEIVPAAEPALVASAPAP